MQYYLFHQGRVLQYRKCVGTYLQRQVGKSIVHLPDNSTPSPREFRKQALLNGGSSTLSSAKASTCLSQPLPQGFNRTCKGSLLILWNPDEGEVTLIVQPPSPLGSQFAPTDLTPYGPCLQP